MRTRPPRGATLIELMISLALLATILGVVVGLLVGAIQNGARARGRADLAREGQFIDTLLRNELRMAGNGVPNVNGVHIDTTYGTTPGAEKFDADVIVFTSTAVGVIGDFPRPDAQYNTLGTLANNPGGNGSTIMWLNENTGSCPPNTANKCTVDTTSPFFPGDTGKCNAVGGQGDRTCPWGMKRLHAGDGIVIASGAGNWTHATASNPLAVSTNGANGNIFLQLSTTWNTVAWPNATNADPPEAVSGEGFVTTIDRVFYNWNQTNRTLERIQCWGDPDPQNANWPNLTTDTMPTLAQLQFTTPNDGAPTATQTCIGPEVMARDVQSVAFTYFNRSGTALTPGVATKNVIARVDWQIKLQRTVNQRPVTQDVVGTAAVRALAQ